MKLKLTCYVRRTEQLRHSPVGNTGHFIVWLVPHNVVNKLKIWFGSTITGNSFTSSHLKKTCVTAIHLLRSLHFIIKFVQLLWNSTKFYKTVGTFCAANIAYWISLLEYIVRTRVQQGGLWMLKPCIQVGTGLCIQTGQSVCVLCLRMSLS